MNKKMDARLSIFVFRCTTIILLGSLLAACDALRKDDQQLVASARQYIEARDVRAAAIELQNALKLNSQNAEARLLLAQINLDVGSAVVAEKEFKQAGKLGAPMDQVSVGLALALLEQNLAERLLEEVPVADDWSNGAQASVLAIRAAAENVLGKIDEATQSLRSATVLEPGNVHVLTSQARILIAEQKNKEALAVLERARMLYPGNQDILFLMAGVAYKQNQTEEIKRILKEIIELDLPKIITVYEWRARLGVAQILMEEGAIDESQAVIEPLMSRIHRETDSQYLAAVLSFKRGEYEAAGRRLHSVLEQDPDHRPALLLLGSVSYFLGEYEQAAYYLSKYVANAPEDIPARKLLGKAYLELEAHKELTQVLEPLVTAKQSDAEVLAMLGMSALRTGRLQDGVADIERAVAMSPDNARLREYLARAYIISGESDRAVSELEAVLAGGEESNAEVLLILAHLRGEDTDKAIAIAADMARDHPNNPKVLTVAGNVYLVSGDSRKARLYFEDALKLAPDFLPATMAVARVYENDGEFSKARVHYEAIIAGTEQKILPMLALANLEERQGREERMLFWLNEAAALNPPQVSPRLMLAKYYLSRMKADIAKALVDEVLAIEPKNLSARLLKVRAFMAEKRYTSALPILTELAESRPDSIPVSLLMAESYLRLDKTGEAMLVAEQILENQPGNIPAHMLMAAVSMSVADYDKALVYAERISELKPEWFKGYELVGDVKNAMQDYPGAELAYQQAMKREPSTALLIKIAQTYMYRGQLSKAERRLGEWMERKGVDDQSLLLLGIIYQRQNNLEKAVKTYESAMARGAADNPIALNNLAGLYDQLNDPRALAMGERAYRSNPDAADIQDTYGWLLTRYGDASEGKRLLEKALVKLPGNPDIRYHLAVALLNTGDKAGAEAILKQLVSDDRDFSSKQEAIEKYKNIK